VIGFGKVETLFTRSSGKIGRRSFYDWGPMTINEAAAEKKS
jgi:hypothetical protein